MEVLIQQFPILSSLLICLVIFMVYRFLIPTKSKIDDFFEETMSESQKNKWNRVGKGKPLTLLIQSFLLLFGYYFRKWKAKKQREVIQEQLVVAGYPGGYNFETYCGLVVLSGCFGLGIGFYFGMMLFSEVNLPLLIIMLLLFTYLPLIWLKERSQDRKWRIAKELPYKIDLITLSVEAGMDLQAAIESVVKRDSGNSPLREEFFHMLQEIRMGKTRKQAMRDMAARLKIDSLDSLVGNIIQGEAMGTPIGHILRVQAEMMRVQRTHRAEKLAGEAPVKLIFPLLFIFLAVFLVLFGSIIVRYLRGEFTI